MRSRAVSLPLACWASIRAGPPPARAAARRRSSSLSTSFMALSDVASAPVLPRRAGRASGPMRSRYQVPLLGMEAQGSALSLAGPF